MDLLGTSWHIVSRCSFSRFKSVAVFPVVRPAHSKRLVPDTAPMSRASLPIWAQCSGGVGFAEMGAAKGSPYVNLQVNMSIPIKDLLQALTLSTSRVSGSFKAPSAQPAHPTKARTVAPVVPCEQQRTEARMLATVPSEQPKIQPRVLATVSVRQEARAIPVTGDWEEFPSRSSTDGSSGQSSGQFGGISSEGYLVRVSNIPSALAPSQIKSSFEQYVGPVLECAIDQGVASIYFASESHATKAVADYDGGIIELAATECTGMGDFGASEEQIEVSLKDNSCCQSYLEDHMGPLSRCSMRRGRGWITIFRSEMGPQLKRDKIDGRSSTQKGFKACFISVYHGYWQRVIDDFMQGGSLDL